MKVPEKDSKDAFLVNRSLREHFRGVPDDFRGPEMNNRGAVELFRRLRKVSKGLERYRKGSKGIERVQRSFEPRHLPRQRAESHLSRNRSADLRVLSPSPSPRRPSVSSIPPGGSLLSHRGQAAPGLHG